MLKQVDWSGGYETPAGKASPGETPQAQRRRGGSRTARGKRVPGEEIKVIVCLQSEKGRFNK